MISVSRAVEQVVEDSSLAYQALKEGILSKANFARRIHKSIEEKTLKKIHVNTIVVALARLEKKMITRSPLLPQIHVKSIEFTSPICDLTFEKTAKTLAKLESIDVQIIMKKGFFTVVEGTEVIAIICSQDIKEYVLKHFVEKPLKEYENLTAVTIKHTPQDRDTPNSTYAVLSKFAVKGINIIDFVIVGDEDNIISPTEYTQKVMDALSGYL